MWGLIPAAGMGSRIQPLAFSKELLPVGSRTEDGRERPRAVCEYLLDRMVKAGADRICLIIGPGKTDIISYFGSSYRGARIAYVVQPQPNGLCDAVFRASPFIDPSEPILLGLPDTIWFPEHGFSLLPARGLSFLLFPVDEPRFFDAVVLDPRGRVKRIEVKSEQASTEWVWGAMRLNGLILRLLEQLWRDRHESDIYLGTLINAWLKQGGRATGVMAGQAYVDVGTLGGYHAALDLLNGREPVRTPFSNGAFMDAS